MGEIYMPDAQVFDLIMFGDKQTIPLIRQLKQRNVRFVVPAAVVAEIKHVDPGLSAEAAKEAEFKTASKLALIRDFGMETQSDAVLKQNSWTPNSKLIAAYNRTYPELQGRPVNDADLAKFFKEYRGPDKNKFMDNSVASFKDNKVLFGVKNFAENEGKGHQVKFLTLERLAKEPERVLKEKGVTLAPESRVIQPDIDRNPDKSQRFKRFVFTQQLYEIHPDLRGKQVSLVRRTADGALAPIVTGGPKLPSTPPRSTFTFRGKLGSGLKTAAAGTATLLADVLISFLVAFIAKKLVEAKQKEMFERDTKANVTPQLIRAIDPKKEDVLELLMLKKRAFAKITLNYSHMEKGPGGQTPDPFTHVKFEAFHGIVEQEMTTPVSVPYNNENELGKQRGVAEEAIGTASFAGERTQQTVELTYSEEEVELYSNFLELMAFFTEQIAFCDVAANQDAENAKVRQFLQSQHEFFRSGLNEALRNAPPPTIL